MRVAVCDICSEKIEGYGDGVSIMGQFSCDLCGVCVEEELVDLRKKLVDYKQEKTRSSV